MSVEAFILGGVVVAQFFMVAAQVYVNYKYNYIPWGVMRKDIAALAQQVANNHAWAKNEMGLRLQTGMTHEEEALAERRMLARLRGQNVA